MITLPPLPRIHWQKKGLIIRPDRRRWWMQTHAMLPTPERRGDRHIRLYFGGRNAANQSHIGHVTIDLDRPAEILAISEEPVLAPGRLGTFDDQGVLPSCVIQRDSLIILYYIGFKPGGTTRMDLFGGLAVSTDGGASFQRWSEAPILERCKVNPFINTAPWVVPTNTGWRMYYVAGVEWVHADLPRYNIQMAESADGWHWVREGRVAIDFAPGENALARPYVIEDRGVMRMWFSAKGDAYRPVYAESHDGLTWTRRPSGADLDPGASGPDREMICYPVVLRHRDHYIMYYNGNGYGREGICLAIGQELG